MAKNYELRKIWRFGPFVRRRVIGKFESLYIAEHVLEEKIAFAKRRKKRVTLEIIDTRNESVVTLKRSR